MIWALLLLVPIGLYLLAMFLVARFSASPIRLPVYLSPGSLGYPQRDVELHAEDGTILRAWWVDRENPEFVAVLAHGYMMNRCEPVPVAAHLHDLGGASLLVDLRAHGKSRGSRTSLGWLERLDVLAAVREARHRHPGVPLVLWGGSMGGAATAFAAAELEPKADVLILDSVYTSLHDAMQGWWGFFLGGKRQWLLKPSNLFARMLLPKDPKEMDVARALEQAGHPPTLLLYGTRDSLAGPSAIERNRRAAGERVRLVMFEGCEHSEGRWLQPEIYRESVESFLRETLRTRRITDKFAESSEGTSDV